MSESPVKSPKSRSRTSGSLFLISGVASAFAIGVSWLLFGFEEISAWGVLGLPILLFVITAPFLLRSKLAVVHGLGPLLCGALALKFVGGFARYFVIQDVYSGSADANRYHNRGEVIANRFRVGDFGVFDLVPTGRGTRFVEEFSGLLQVIVGSDQMANFMFFAWLGFLGLLGMVVAARRAVPGLMVRRYAMLVLLLPTTVFWSSSVGKDTLMIFFLGLFAMGAARVFTRSSAGFLLMGIGVVGVSYVRPHLALLLLASFGVALVLARRLPSQSMKLPSPAFRIIGVALLLVGFSFVVSQAGGLIPGFGVDGSLDLNATLEQTSAQTSIGGSEVDVVRPNNPLEYPAAFVTVMFRPLPFEVKSAMQAIAALESTVLIAFVFVWRKQIVAGVRRSFSEPYLAMAALYTLAFGFAWSSVGNLGLIARQRVQVLPFLVLFLCVGLANSERRQAVDETPTAVLKDPET